MEFIESIIEFIGGLIGGISQDDKRKLVEFIEKHPIIAKLALYGIPLLIVVFVPLIFALLFIQVYMSLLELFVKYQITCKQALEVFGIMFWFILSWYVFFGGIFYYYLRFIVAPRLLRAKPQES